MKYSKRDNIVCFSKSELEALYQASEKAELLNEIVKEGYSSTDLVDSSTMEKLTDSVARRRAADRDKHEIFAALYVYVNFCGPGNEICFELKPGFNPRSDRIASLEDLIRFRNTDSDSDFIIRAIDGVRILQLKRYRGALDPSGVFNFIKQEIAHYGNNLGDTNLVIQLQPPRYTIIDQDFFHEVHDRLKMLGLTFRGEVLISFNQDGKEQILIQVYPELTQMRIPTRY